MTASPTLRSVEHLASPAPAATLLAPAEDEPSLAIALGTRNRLAHVKNCLDSLLGRVNATREINVADAGSTDGPLEYLQGLPGIRLVMNGVLDRAVSVLEQHPDFGMVALKVQDVEGHCRHSGGLPGQARQGLRLPATDGKLGRLIRRRPEEWECVFSLS